MDFKYKILMVHNYYQIAGGEDTVIANEKKLLEKKGHNVILYTKNSKDIGNMNIFQKCFLAFTSIFSLKTYMQIRKVIKEENIDIIHIHNTLPLISNSVYYAAYSKKVPIVQTIHNYRLLCPNGLFFREACICKKCTKNLLNAVKYRCYRKSYLQSFLLVISMKIHRLLRTYDKASAFILLTEFNAKQFENILDKKKVFIKPNFGMVNTIMPVLEKRVNRFIYIGRLDSYKGVYTLLDAWQIFSEDFRDVELLLIGNGDELENLNKYIYKNKLKKINCTGFLPHDIVLENLSKSIALIMPTQVYEGFPMTIVESFSLGTPVIGSNIGNVNDILRQNYGGFTFRYDDAGDLALKMKHIYNMSDKQELYKKILYNFQSKYSEDVNYDILNKIYHYSKDNID